MSTIFFKEGEVTQNGRKRLRYLSYFWIVVLLIVCFLPMSWYPNPKTSTTPGIFQIGRLYFLLIPFNSIINMGKVQSGWDYFWMVWQNLSNIFLLFPLIFSKVVRFKNWQSVKHCLCCTFLVSLLIESGQLCLDYLFDAGRVFELDDLWSNTLGGLIAYFVYLYIQQSKKSF